MQIYICLQKNDGFSKSYTIRPVIMNQPVQFIEHKRILVFSYEANEALHLSVKERELISDCLNMIGHELHQSIDKHSKTLIANTIELLLNYCMRFYDLQFITHSHVNWDILVKFERLLEEYFYT